MKHIVLTLAILCLIESPLSFAEDEPATKVYRDAIQELGGALKSELKGAIKTGGFVKALDVCQTKAPKISAELSKKVGFSISRTSLKPRNPNNAPSEWEKDVLEQFEKRKADGENPKSLEFMAVVEKDGQRERRYMKAIMTQGPCLSCHGKDIDAPIVAKLKELYPDDQATGFEAGDLRGAFSITEVLEK
jgi:hypothetical protein